MPDHTELPDGFSDSLKEVQALQIPNLVIRQPPFPSVAEHAIQNERVPVDFPHPEEHFVIGDYLIDLPVIAIDLAKDSTHRERILGYSTGTYWVIAETILEFVERLKIEHDGALFGK